MTISGSSGPRLVLDTSAYSHLRAGHDDVHALVAAADVVHVPTIVLGELQAAFRGGRRERGDGDAGRSRAGLLAHEPQGPAIESESRR